MIRFLIVENDLKFAKKIITNIIKPNDQIRLIDIITSTNIEEVISTLNTYRPHICLINSDQINVERFVEIKNKTIFICTTNDNLKSAIKKYYLKNSISPIKEQIEKAIKETEYKRTKEYIENEFHKLKFKFDNIGTKYLIESILFSHFHPNPYIHENLEKNVYPEVAKKFNTEALLVKKCIVKAVNNMYKNNINAGTAQKMSKYFYLSNIYKPTAKLIITIFLTHLWGNVYPSYLGPV